MMNQPVRVRFCSLLHLGGPGMAEQIHPHYRKIQNLRWTRDELLRRLLSV